MKVAVKNLAGKKVEDLELNPDIFEVKINEDLLHQVYVARANNQRRSTAHAKTRSERTGSTAKPWKQKGTGRARTGSVKNPIWRKGGVTFGPRNERNYQQKVNKKMNQSAIKMALTGKAKEKELIVVDEYKLKEKKTKEFAKALNKLKADRKALLVFNDEEKDLKRYSRNIPQTQNISVGNLNVFDMLNSKYLVISKKGIDYLGKKYEKSEKR